MLWRRAKARLTGAVLGTHALRQVLTWHPRIFLLHDFLTATECDELIALALPELEASTVVDTATGGGFLSQVRTSSGMFIMENTLVTKVIRQRIAHLTLLPGTCCLGRVACVRCSRQPFAVAIAAEENQEAISVLQYKACTQLRRKGSAPAYLLQLSRTSRLVNTIARTRIFSGTRPTSTEEASALQRC